MRKILLFIVLTSSLSACAVYDAGSAVVDVAATTVSAATDVVCTVACSSSDDDNR